MILLLSYNLFKLIAHNPDVPITRCIPITRCAAWKPYTALFLYQNHKNTIILENKDNTIEDMCGRAFSPNCMKFL